MTFAAAGICRQRIGLVDEQDAVERLAASVEGFGRGLSHIACYQPGTVGLYDLSFAQNLQRPEDLADHAGDLGLADAGRPRENHVLTEGCDGQSLRAAP